MTPEELKKIARLFAYETSNGDALDPHIDFAEEYAVEVLQWLSKKYCIVEKSKVIGLWNEINNDAKVNIENGFPDYAEFNKLQLTPLEILFGKDMFEE